MVNFSLEIKRKMETKRETPIKKVFKIPINHIPQGVDQDEFVRGILKQFKKDGLPPLDIEIVGK